MNSGLETDDAARVEEIEKCMRSHGGLIVSKSLKKLNLAIKRTLNKSSEDLK